MGSGLPLILSNALSRLSLSPKISPSSSLAKFLLSHPSQMALSLFVCTAGDLSKFHLAPLGGTAELLCPVSSWPSMTLSEVRWLRSPPPGRSQVVHLFQDGKDREEEVMPEYKGRTEMARDDQEGNITLKIHHVRLEDKGLYRCQVQIGNRSREGTVTLQVAG